MRGGVRGGGGGIVLDASTAETIRNRFDDLAAEFRNTRTSLAAHYRGMTEGCGGAGRVDRERRVSLAVVERRLRRLLD